MFDRLVDLIADFIELFFCLCVVDCFEEAVILRFGKFKRKLGPGLHWKIPFGVDAVYKANVVLETKDLPAQAFTTKDGVTAVASAVVTLTIRDVEKLLLKVENADVVLTDASRGIIRQVLCTKTWESLQSMETSLDLEITEAVRRAAFKWGIEVHKVQLSDLVRARTLRVIHDGTVLLEMVGDDDES